MAVCSKITRWSNQFVSMLTRCAISASAFQQVISKCGVAMRSRWSGVRQIYMPPKRNASTLLVLM